MKKILLVMGMTMLFFSCDDRLEDLNQPRKNGSEVPYETLFTGATRNLFDMMVSTDVNENNYRLYAQYWAQTTYPDESQYDMVGRQVPDNYWQNAYRDVLKDLSEAKKLLVAVPDAEISAEDRATQEGIITTLEVYAWSTVVDNWGAAPFSETFDEENLNPAYEDGAAIYAAIIGMLNEAIVKMQSGGAGIIDTQDLIYHGDVEKWLKFANSLKVRLAVTISDVDAAKATVMINEALEAGVFTGNADNATIAYLSQAPNTNPLWESLVQSGRNDFVISNTIVDKLLELNDPRLEVFAEPVEGETEYVGGIYGTANTYSLYSHVGDQFHDPALAGVIMDFAEVNFLLAEAVAKGLAVGGLTAAEYYEAGIRASFEYWGVEGVEDYLAQEAVAYATADGDWKQKIGTQQWLAYYNRGFEGWNVWRRLDFDGFNVPPGLTEADIPRRLIFPIKEATLNPQSLLDAIQMIGGSDNVQTRVFWDVS